MDNVRSLIRALFSKLMDFFNDSSGTTVSLTGVLGLAAVIYGLYQARDYRWKRGPSRPASGATPSVSCTAATKRQTSPLAALSKVTISIPGVLIEEETPDQLEESATVLPSAVDLLRQLVPFGEVYLIAHVLSDIGEVVVRGALEHAGVTGLLPAHRILFCETLEGKVSIVRQVEPVLHIDGHSSTIIELTRFVSKLSLIDRNKQHVGKFGQNVKLAKSFEDALFL